MTRKVLNLVKDNPYVHVLYSLPIITHLQIDSMRKVGLERILLTVDHILHQTLTNTRTN